MWEKIKNTFHTYGIVFVAIVFYVFLNLLAKEIHIVGVFVNIVIKLLTPFFMAFGIAFLLYSPCKTIEKILGKIIQNKNIVRVFSVVITMLLMLLAVIGIIWLIIPQIIESLQRLTPLLSQAEGHVQSVNSFLKNNYNFDFSKIISGINYQEILNKDVTQSLITTGLKISATTLKNILNLLIAIIAAVYLLIDREKFLRYIKKTNYAIFSQERADNLYEITLLAKNIFNNFIIGKIIDSIIIGIICYIGMVIFKFEYALLISFFVGVTNVIPVFGPFIGGIPGVLILMLTDPIQGVWFALFVFALQQFDGNILGPYILGDKLGLPSLGILIAVVIGGGLFGFLGMLLGVPVFALLFELGKRKINKKLNDKKIVIE